MSHNPVATVFSAVLQDGINGSPTLQQLVQPLNLLVASLNLKKYFIKTSFNIPYLFKLKHSTSKERPSQKRTHLEWAPILNKCPPWSSKKLISNHPFPPPLKKLHKSTWLQNFSSYGKSDDTIVYFQFPSAWMNMIVCTTELQYCINFWCYRLFFFSQAAYCNFCFVIYHQFWTKQAIQYVSKIKTFQK